MASDVGVSRRITIGLVALVVGVAAFAIQLLVLSGAVARFAFDSIRRDQAAVPYLVLREPGEMLHVLVVGNDTREALPTDDPYWFGTLTGQRADVVILVAIDASGTQTRLLSLDRDLRVETSEYGPLTLSESFGYGGSPLLVRSVAQLTDLPIHHYVELSFDGFVNFIDRLEGVTVPFCAPSRDLITGLYAPSGSIELDGEAALALVRSRAFERWVDGEWAAVAQGNTGRADRQRFVVGRVLEKLRDDLGVLEAVALAFTVKDVAVVDARFGFGTMLDIIGASRTNRVEWLALPTVPLRSQTERTSPFPPDHLGGRLYLRPGPEAAETLREFSSGDVLQLSDNGEGSRDATSDPPRQPDTCL